MKDSIDIHILAHTHLQATFDKHKGVYWWIWTTSLSL